MKSIIIARLLEIAKIQSQEDWMKKACNSFAKFLSSSKENETYLFAYGQKFVCQQRHNGFFLWDENYPEDGVRFLNGRLSFSKENWSEDFSLEKTMYSLYGHISENDLIVFKSHWGNHHFSTLCGEREKPSIPLLGKSSKLLTGARVFIALLARQALPICCLLRN